MPLVADASLFQSGLSPRPRIAKIMCPGCQGGQPRIEGVVVPDDLLVRDDQLPVLSGRLPTALAPQQAQGIATADFAVVPLSL